MMIRYEGEGNLFDPEESAGRLHLSNVYQLADVLFMGS